VKPIIMQAPTTSVASTAEIVRSIGDYGFDVREPPTRAD